MGVFWLQDDCCLAHLSTYLFSDLTSWTCTSIFPNFLLKVPLGSFTVGGYLLARRWLLHSPHRWVGTLRSATSSHDSWPGFRSPRDPLQHHPWPLHPTYQVVPCWHYLLLAAPAREAPPSDPPHHHSATHLWVPVIGQVTSPKDSSQQYNNFLALCLFSFWSQTPSSGLSQYTPCTISVEAAKCKSEKQLFGIFVASLVFLTIDFFSIWLKSF